MTRFLRVLAAALATRRTYAIGSMVAGVGAATAGASVLWGLGVSLLVLAGLLIVLSVLTGWE